MTRTLSPLAAVALFAASTSIVRAGNVPDAVVGNWLYTTSSATTYWSDTGQFLGNGRSGAQFYEFKADGTFRYFMYLEMRTGNFVSKVHTTCEGTVKFAAHKFTLNVTKGHYHTEMGSTIKDRPMTDEDFKRMSKTNAWELSKSDDGKPTFVIPFEDGSKTVFKPAEPPPEPKKKN